MKNYRMKIKKQKLFEEFYLLEALAAR